MIVAAINSKLSWYAARASGLIAWSVVTVSIVLGLVVATRLVRRKGVPAWLLDLHKFLGTLSVLFVGVHVLALWADNFVSFGPAALFVPLASHWRPFPVAWGIAATYLLVAIQLTSWTMRHLPRRLWHAVHMSSLPMFVLATVHGFTAGADYRNVAVQWGAMTGGLLVIFLLTFRTLAPRRARAGRSSRPARPPSPSGVANRVLTSPKPRSGPDLRTVADRNPRLTSEAVRGP